MKITQKNKGKKVDQSFLETLEKSRNFLENGNSLRNLSYSQSQEDTIKTFNLLTYKPIIYVCNVDEDSLINGNQYSEQVEAYSMRKIWIVQKISAKIESEILVLDLNEKIEFLESIGLKRHLYQS